MRGLDPKATQALGLAWAFGWRVVAGLFLGFYLDRWLGTDPLFLVVLAIGSLVASVAELLRLSRAPRTEQGEE